MVLGETRVNFGGRIATVQRSDVRPPDTAPRRGLRVRLYAALVLLDAAAIFLAFMVGSLVRFGELGNGDPIDFAIVIIPVYVGIALNSGAYAIDVLRTVRLGVARACGALAFTLAAVALIAYYLRAEQDVSRLAVGTGMGVSFVFLVLFRNGFDQLIQRTWGGVMTTEMVILDEVMVQTPRHARVLDAAAENLRPNSNDPMMLDRLARRLRGVDRVVVACRPDAERSWAMLLKGCNIQGEVVATEFDAVGAIGLSSLCDRTTLVVSTGPLNLRNRVVKRLFDLAFTVPAVFMLAPMMVLVALAIVIDSGGPIFFRQKRVGRGNALFDVYKFRSMRTEACDVSGDTSTRRDDDRVTRVGAFIRKTSIDELPQLLNVLFGSMSLVGPRPHALGSLAGQQLFWEVDERYWHRHALKPGITGLAQVRGYRGATLKRDDLTRRLQADLEYIAGWSVWRDFAILLSTVRVVVHKNAY